MSIPTNDGVNAELYCSLFGHNFIIKPNTSSDKEEHICKTCKEKFILNDLDAYSGLPKTSEFILLLRTLLYRVRTKKGQLIS